MALTGRVNLYHIYNGAGKKQLAFPYRLRFLAHFAMGSAPSAGGGKQDRHRLDHMFQDRGALCICGERHDSGQVRPHLAFAAGRRISKNMEGRYAHLRGFGPWLEYRV